MSSLHEFVTMGGYAFYVWTSYAVALIVLVANFLLPLFRGRRLRRELARRTRLPERREPAHRMHLAERRS